MNEGTEGQDIIYDEATLNMLETRRDDMINGKDKTYTLEQTIENIGITRRFTNTHLL